MSISNRSDTTFTASTISVYEDSICSASNLALAGLGENRGVQLTVDDAAGVLFTVEADARVGDIIGNSGDENYKEWSKRIEALHYYYEQDIDYLIERMSANEMTFDDIFTVKNGQHPPILKMVLSKRISIETFVILEDLLSFSKRLNEDISETVLWPKLHDRMVRYRPFLKFNITKYRVTLRNKLKDI